MRVSAFFIRHSHLISWACKLMLFHPFLTRYYSLPPDFLTVNDVDARCHPLLPRPVFHLFTSSHLTSHQVVNASVTNHFARSVGVQFLLFLIIKDDGNKLRPSLLGSGSTTSFIYWNILFATHFEFLTKTLAKLSKNGSLHG